MQTVGGMWVPLAALVAAASVSQWLLGEIRFSSVKAETVFRALFFAPAVLDAVLIVRRARRGRAAWRLWVLSVPIWGVVAMMAAAFADSDAQGAIFVFMLPFGHVAMSAICCLLTHPHSTGTSQ